MDTFTFQPALRPALTCIYGPLDFRQQKALYERLDKIIATSGLESEFISLAMQERGIEVKTLSAKKLESFAFYSVLAMRSNIARCLTGLDHREFSVRLADSSLLQWFLNVGQVDGVKAFSKSTSDRFSRWTSESAVRQINVKLVALLAADGLDAPAISFGLAAPLAFDDVFFDSTCLKANIHFPVDWVLLRDAVRTLMKATVLIRNAGLKQRMPKEPLLFLSEMNTLCMKMSAKSRATGSKKQRKRVVREMKALQKRVEGHARAHMDALSTRWKETELSEKQAAAILARIEGVLGQLPAAIKQVHERIIGERQVPNSEKILSLYDADIDVIVRGKANARVEFGNKLWLGETKDGLLVDYRLHRDNPTDTTLVAGAVTRLLEEQKLEVKSMWGDRGLFSKANAKMLEEKGIRSGLCPRDVSELKERLDDEPGFREGLKRRAGIEARIGIFCNVFMGKPSLAKGFEHRELAVGWAVLTHNLWVAGRLAEAEAKRKEKETAQAEARSQAA